VRTKRHRFDAQSHTKEKLHKQQKRSSHQLRKEKGLLGKKSPSPKKKRAVSEDQEGCGQTSQQTSPD